MRMHLTPIEYVLRIFGGMRKLALALECDPAQPCRWAQPRGSSSGLIPVAQQAKLLLVARERRLDLTADDMIFGRDLEVAEPVAAR